MRSVKCVVVGDGVTDKARLMATYINNKLPEYVPMVFENTVKVIEVDGQQVTLSLWDTSGQEDYDRLRPFSYDEVDVVVLLFNISESVSFLNLKDKWWPEIQHFCPNIPCLLVATGKEFRTPKFVESTLVEASAGVALQKKIGAKSYIECSINNLDDVNRVFTEAIRLGISMKKPVRRLSLTGVFRRFSQGPRDHEESSRSPRMGRVMS